MESPTYNSATYTFNANKTELKTHALSSTEDFQKKLLLKSKLKEMDPKSYADTFWCYDTPGLVNPNQVSLESSYYNCYRCNTYNRVH